MEMCDAGGSPVIPVFSHCLFSVSCTVDIDPKGSDNHVLNTANVADIYEIFITVMSDYTLDSRGDVGAW